MICNFEFNKKDILLIVSFSEAKEESGTLRFIFQNLKLKSSVV